MKQCENSPQTIFNTKVLKLLDPMTLSEKSMTFDAQAFRNNPKLLKNKAQRDEIAVKMPRSNEYEQNMYASKLLRRPTWRPNRVTTDIDAGAPGIVLEPVVPSNKFNQ